MKELTIGGDGAFGMVDHGLSALVRGRLDRRVRDLRLLVTDDGLVLMGRSYTWYGKQLAQHAAMELTGLRVTLNAIDVAPPRHADDGPEGGHTHV